LGNKQYYRVCYCTDMNLDVCIFIRFKANCEVMPLRNFANFKLVMSRQRKELRGAPKSAEPWAMAYA